MIHHVPLISSGPLPLRGPRPLLLPQAARCKSPQGCLLIAYEGANATSDSKVHDFKRDDEN